MLQPFSVSERDWISSLSFRCSSPISIGHRRRRYGIQNAILPSVELSWSYDTLSFVARRLPAQSLAGGEPSDSLTRESIGRWSAAGRVAGRGGRDRRLSRDARRRPVSPAHLTNEQDRQRLMDVLNITS